MALFLVKCIKYIRSLKVSLAFIGHQTFSIALKRNKVNLWNLVVKEEKVIEKYKTTPISAAHLCYYSWINFDLNHSLTIQSFNKFQTVSCKRTMQTADHDNNMERVHVNT